jgi:hypothetical protein
LYGAETWTLWWDTREVLKDTADQMERSCEKCRSITYSHGGNEHSTYNEQKEGYLDWSYLALALTARY